MSQIPPIEGMVAYDFREAINALAHSTADIATLTACWYDLCNAVTPMEVNISLSDGRSKTVPNLAMAIESMKRREGEIDATSVTVKGQGRRVKLLKEGVSVGAQGAGFADGETKDQFSYKTPFNDFYDAYHVSNAASCYDVIEFLSLPRFLFFDTSSSLNEAATHAISIRPIPDTAALVKDRTDQGGGELTARMTLVNTDPLRTAHFIFATSASGLGTALELTLTPGEHAEFLAWSWRGKDTCNLIRL